MKNILITENHVKQLCEITNKEIKALVKDVNTKPTEKQKESGNYKKAQFNIVGLKITIENPKNSYRYGVDEKGVEWKVKMNNHYGYINGTEGNDGDHIDIFMGNNLKSNKVFVIDQVHGDKFDEHKVMLFFDTKKEAKEAYLSNFTKGWKGLGEITEDTLDNFKEWVKKPNKKTQKYSKIKK